MIRALLVAATLSITAACSPVGAFVADGGHFNQGCFGGNVVLPVKVLDANNKPVAGAVVTATNRGSGKSLTGTTDGNGNTAAVTEAIGAGEVDISAKDGTRLSETFRTQWTCGECDCLASPSSATLHVQ